MLWEGETQLQERDMEGVEQDGERSRKRKGRGKERDGERDREEEVRISDVDMGMQEKHTYKIYQYSTMLCKTFKCITVSGVQCSYIAQCHVYCI